MVPLLAFSLQDQVEKYGAYIGIAAFFGLAVLTILYFAQAKELRRLRDWAGRAPERAQEVEARAIAQAEAARRVQAEPRRTPAPAAAAPATAAGAGAAPATTGGAAAAQGEQATQVVEPAEAGAHSGNGTTAAASEAGEGEGPPAEETANGQQPPAAEGSAEPEEERAEGAEPADDAAEPDAEPADDAAEPGAEAAAPSGAGEHDEPQSAEQGGDAAEAEPDADPDAAAGPAPAGASPRAGDVAPPAGAAAGESDRDDGPAEAPVAPVPRATPLPRRAPAPAAPLRQPGRSATLPPRRSAPAARAVSGSRRPAGRSGAGSWLVPGLVGAGALVLAVIALFATGVLGGREDAASPPNVAGTATPDTGAPAEQLTPASTKVAVLNGTTIPGLASREKDTLAAAGYTGIATGNNTDQQRASSSVLYGTRPGARTQARNVARSLNVSTVERLDADTRDLSEDADVVVILGQDKAP